jgi:transcription-repair coupling factor (superfamily II helicase)
LSENSIFCKNVQQYSDLQAAKNGFFLVDLKLSQSFCVDNIVFIPDEVFIGKKLASHDFSVKKVRVDTKKINSLEVGCFVVHKQYGLGRFDGTELITTGGITHECIKIIYADNSALYVPVENIGQISKYEVSSESEIVVQLDSLKSKSWQGRKKRTESKIQEMAFEILKIAASRKSSVGEVYNTVLRAGVLQKIEYSFNYVETEDQLKAIESVYDDLSNGRIMNRLVCGDVGFGKTEVAIRAAFKAVADSKQVAVLVPTTILCHQHARSFAERLKNFPCKVDYINRFKSAKEITETLKKVASGEVDILVGTHKIVGEKVKFKDLGLIIIDEEQKFGVAVKDKLKTLKTTVDTLTLTATPIPRTLQFSLMGARDLSIINTPPPNRQPVLTEVMTFQEDAIRDAISYEVSRGGQVYFVNNRLSNIKEIAGMISRLCPGIRVGIGHGQMEGKQLEKIMMDFIQGEYDVLIATTIIESGIDISNANTIIINDAHNFGLSDLHQLRGRVGRSNKKGFCYLISQPISLLTSEARKRLEALVQFSDLGSGFNIAMKDLDIRGAGNLLGGEQSGFISEIGFEMYQKILNEAMDELKEEEFKDLYDDRTTETMGAHFVKDCVLETDFELRIPEDYINNVSERLSIYQEIDGLNTVEELAQHKQQLIDRFGPMPRVVKELFRSFELRWLAESLGFEKLVIKQGAMIGYFVSNPQSKYYDSPIFTQVLKYVQRSPINCKMSEKNDRLRLMYTQVMNMDQAFERLNEIDVA